MAVFTGSVSGVACDFRLFLDIEISQQETLGDILCLKQTIVFHKGIPLGPSSEPAQPARAPRGPVVRGLWSASVRRGLRWKRERRLLSPAFNVKSIASGRVGIEEPSYSRRRYTVYGERC